MYKEASSFEEQRMMSSTQFLKEIDLVLSIAENENIDEKSFLNHCHKINIYFQEIREFNKHLPSEEQLKYVYFYQKIKNLLEKNKNLTFKKELSLIKDLIIELLIFTNEKLIEKYAKPAYLRQKMEIPYEYLFAAGVDGLIKAIERFDLQKDNVLSTYAVWWIRQRINRYIQNNRSEIRIPVHLQDKIGNLIKKISKYSNEHGGIGKKEFDEIVNSVANTEKEAETIKTVLRTSFLSLDSLADENDKDGAEKHDFVKDKNKNTEESALREIEQEETKIKVLSILKNEQSKKGIAIFLLTSGIHDGEKVERSTVSDIYLISRERVRQLIEESISILESNISEYDQNKKSSNEEYEMFCFDFIEIPQLLRHVFPEEKLEIIHSYFGIFNNWYKSKNLQNNEEIRKIKKQLLKIKTQKPIDNEQINLLDYFNEKNNPKIIEEGDLEKRLKSILSKRELEAIYLRYKKDLPLKEVAEKMNISLNTCEKYSKNARKKIKDKNIKTNDEKIVNVIEFLKLKNNIIKKINLKKEIRKILVKHHKEKVIVYLEDYYGLSKNYPLPSKRQIEKENGLSPAVVLKSIKSMLVKLESYYVETENNKLVPLVEYLENLRNLKQTTVSNFKIDLRKILTEKQYQAVILKYGLNGSNLSGKILDYNSNRLLSRAIKKIEQIRIDVKGKNIGLDEYLDSIKKNPILKNEEEILEYTEMAMDNDKNKQLKMEVIDLKYGFSKEYPLKNKDIAKILSKKYNEEILESDVTKMCNETLNFFDRKNLKITNQNEVDQNKKEVLVSSYLLDKLDIPALIKKDKVLKWLKYLLTPRQFLILNIYLKNVSDEDFYSEAIKKTSKETKQLSKKNIYTSINNILQKISLMKTKVIDNEGRETILIEFINNLRQDSQLARF